MSIRPIDFQIMIPKSQEVQKIKQNEIDNHKTNAQINIQKESEHQSELLKQVNETDKPFESKIHVNEENQKQGSKRDRKKKKSNKENDEEKGGFESTAYRDSFSKIDVRI